MNTLTVLVGLPASGKSSWAEHMYKATLNNDCAIRTMIVSSDDIREELCGDRLDQSKNEEVFKVFHKRIKEYIELGYNVIADATNISIKSRAVILRSIDGTDCIKHCIVIVKDYKTCIEHNKLREQNKRVPEEVITRMMKGFQMPFREEGFDNIQVVDNTSGPVTFDYNECRNKMKGFDQENSHHNQTLYEHSVTVTSKLLTKYCGNLYYYIGMLHDLGKLYTKVYGEDGQAHYYNHAEVGAYILLTNFYHVMHDLELNDQQALDLIFAVNYHMLPFGWKTDKAKNKWKKIFGEEKFELLAYFNECDRFRIDKNTGVEQ